MSIHRCSLPGPDRVAPSRPIVAINGIEIPRTAVARYEYPQSRDQAHAIRRARPWAQDVGASTMEHLCRWLSHTAVSEMIQKTTWVIPAVQSVHILAVAVVMASVLMLDLRLLGVVGNDTTVAVLEKRFLPPVWIALLVLLISGVVLIIGEPRRELLNTLFRIKMLMVVVVALLTLLLQRRARGEVGYWEASPAGRISVKGLALVSLILWTAILTAGRWIAYTMDA